MSALEPSLAGAALLIGLTGAWSPCGFSMVETIGLAGDQSRRRTTIAACATFAPGAVIGVAFGIGRSIPVLLVAPIVDTRLGIRCIELMAERPALYRAFRFGDALTLGLVAAALAASGAATAAVTDAPHGADPSASGRALAYQRGDRSGVLRYNGVHGLPGRDPAIGGRMVAWHTGSRITVARRDLLTPVLTLHVRGVDKLAVSDRWLVYRAYGKLRGRRLASPRRALHIARSGRGGQVGRPAINGDTVVYSITGPAGSAIAAVDLRRRHGRVIRRTRASQFLNPTVLGKHLLYVRVSRGPESPQATHPRKLRQRLMLKRIGHHGPGHTIYSHGQDRRLWTTSLSGKRAFVTVLGGGGPKIVSAQR